uniref:Uncharacterized protein n=1 Tax=Lotus japonicus TaxID=34305 RepID=I3SXB8_LOTJA|nr:unknown [Lotus japonicus]
MWEAKIEQEAISNPVLASQSMQVMPQKLYQQSKILKRQPSRYLYWGQEQTQETKKIIQGHLPNQYQPLNEGQLIIYS